MAITQEQLDNWFRYHPPTVEQVHDYARLRDAAKSFAEVVLYSTPPSADQTAALRKIREAVMTANAAIACGGPQEIEEQARRDEAHNSEIDKYQKAVFDLALELERLKQRSVSEA